MKQYVHTSRTKPTRGGEEFEKCYTPKDLTPSVFSEVRISRKVDWRGCNSGIKDQANIWEQQNGLFSPN